MDLTEKTIKENKVYEGRIFNVYSDEVSLPDGTHSKRDWVQHNGGAGILVVDENKEVYLVKQYRYAVGKEMLEIPAGKIDKGENPYDTAIRELEEELGFKADKVESLGVLLPTVGYVSEHIYLYLATTFTKTKQKLDEGEFVNIVRIPLEKLVNMIKNDEIEDGKTITAVTKYLLKTKQLG